MVSPSYLSSRKTPQNPTRTTWVICRAIDNNVEKVCADHPNVGSERILYTHPIVTHEAETSAHVFGVEKGPLFCLFKVVTSKRKCQQCKHA